MFYRVEFYIAASLTALFKHIGSIDESQDETREQEENIREKVLAFIRDKACILDHVMLSSHF